MAVAGLERKTNPLLVELIVELRKAAQTTGAGLWTDIADRLERPAKLWPQVNVDKVSGLAHDDEIVLVPGKVLSTGEPKKGLKVAAFNFSENARQKIMSAGGQCLAIQDVVRMSPKGRGVRIVQ
jgi:large subunit ribosomal protein L18e